MFRFVRHHVQFQSTRPRGARPPPSCEIELVSSVSIHAPTRGATMLLDSDPDKQPVSIHAPTRGATRVFGVCNEWSKFQSTRPRGARPPTPPAENRSEQVSIHAPTRGATLLMKHVQSRHIVSIHAPTRGATRLLSDLRAGLIVSIHAPTRGATR